MLLIDVLDKENSGRLVIPRFITDIRYRELPFYGENGSALKGCKYREVYIDNSSDKWINSRGLCSDMESESIHIEFKNPKMVLDMGYMFNRCKLLKEIDISKLDTSNVGNMEGDS